MNPRSPIDLSSYLRKLRLPEPTSRKGQNGKILIIGGSELFHAASKWSLDIASRFVDMVFYCSVPSNAELVKEAKGQFWNGIVITAEQIDEYVSEADVVLIGPGMTRTPDTTETTNRLLATWPDKKMVVDAGALQMCDPHLLRPGMIITPHQQELELLLTKVSNLNELRQTGVGLVIKGASDQLLVDDEEIIIEGGNAGMTKGGTGDVLAGLIAALYATQDKKTAMVLGSAINKKAGDALYQRVGPYFNASDLVAEIPAVLWQEVQKITS